MVSSLISRLVILVFGTLYPAYASYKAVKTKNVKEHVKWMMYWIVFALFTCAETITDVLFSWFPFYYEIKIIIVIWLLSPATRGSSILYRKFVHPTLASKEQEIDDYISKAKERSYKQVLDLGSKGVNVLMQTAIKNFGLSASSLMPSLSESALSDSTRRRATRDEGDGQASRTALIARSQSAHQVTMMTIDERQSEDGDSNDDSEMIHYENTQTKVSRKVLQEQNQRAYSSDDDEVISTLCEPAIVEKRVAKSSRNTKAKGKTATKRATRRTKPEILDLED